MPPRYIRRTKNKFGAKKEAVDGIIFDSRKEARRYRELKLLQTSGEIQSLEIHPKFKFTIDGRPVLIRSEGYPKGRHASYSCDFRYWCNRRQAVVTEDVKSEATKTPVYKLKKALVEAMWPGTVIVEI